MVAMVIVACTYQHGDGDHNNLSYRAAGITVAYPETIRRNLSAWIPWLATMWMPALASSSGCNHRSACQVSRAALNAIEIQKNIIIHHQHCFHASKAEKGVTELQEPARGCSNGTSLRGALMMLKRVYAMNAGLSFVKPNEENKPFALRMAANSAKLKSICAWTMTRFFSVWPSFQCPACRATIHVCERAALQPALYFL